MTARIRIEDVAAAAGVSMKTVSRVLNNEPQVHVETRRRVQETVAQLNYRPNPSARNLAGRRSYVVALAYDNPSRNYLAEVQIGALEACRANHYNLVLAQFAGGRRETAEEVAALVERSGFDGVVLTPPLTDDSELLAYLEAHAVPFACISPRERAGRIGVALEETAAARDMVTRLIQHGHRRIGHILGHPQHGACDWRLDGYRDALDRAGLPFDAELVVPGDFSFDGGVAGARRLLDLPNPPSAIFAANDDSAAGVIRVAGERRIQIPLQLSVCGFDDTPIARHIFPSLTTVRQPTQDLGRVATLELLKDIRERGSGRMVRLDYALQVRESIGPAPLP